MRIITIILSITVSLTAISCSSSENSREHQDPAEMFARMDNDADGRISWDEFKSLPSRMGSPENRFLKIDANSDGYLTMEEFKAARPEGRPGGGPGRGGRR